MRASACTVPLLSALWGRDECDARLSGACRRGGLWILDECRSAALGVFDQWEERRGLGQHGRIRKKVDEWLRGVREVAWV